MSLLPVLRELLDDNYSRTIYDQNFGLGLTNEDIMLRPVANMFMSPSLWRNGYLRPWRYNSDSGVATVTSDKNEFKITLDVQQFKPEELKVRIHDGHLIVEAAHEERSDDHGMVSRNLTRRYKLPENVIQESMESSLSSDGILTVKAPKKVIGVEEGRSIPIVQTKMPAVTSEKDKKKTDKKDEKMES